MNQIENYSVIRTALQHWAFRISDLKDREV